MPRLLRCLFWKSASWRRGEVLRIARPLDPDHVGAPVAELAHADRTGARMGQVEDGQTFERARGRLCIPLLCSGSSYSAMIELRALDEMLGRGRAPLRTVLLQRHAVDRIDLDPRRGRGLDEFGILDRGVEGVTQRLARARAARWAPSPAACRARRRRRSSAMTWRSSSLRASSCTDGISRSFGFRLGLHQKD